MTNQLIAFFVFIGLIAFLACCSRKGKAIDEVNTSNSGSKLETFAKEKFEADYSIVENKTNEYAIISKSYKIKPSDQMPTIRFEIVDVSTLESLFADAVAAGEIIWEDDYVVFVKSNIGIPGPDGKLSTKTYRYHAKNRKKYSGGFFKNKK